MRVLLSSAGQIQSVSIVDASTGSSAGVSLQVGGTLTPYVFVPSSSNYQQVLSTQSIQVTEELQVDFVRLPAKSQFDMGLVVQDAAGNAATAFASGAGAVSGYRRGERRRHSRGRTRWTCRSSTPSSRAGSDSSESGR